MAQLEHRFAAGVRFDTEVQYRAQHGRGLRFQKLPVLKSASAQVCAFTSALQAVAVVSQLPIRQLMGGSERQAQAELNEGSNQPNERQLLACIRALDGGVQASWSLAADGEDVGRQAVQVIKAQGLMLVYASATGSNWRRSLAWKPSAGVGSPGLCCCWIRIAVSLPRGQLFGVGIELTWG